MRLMCAPGCRSSQNEKLWTPENLDPLEGVDRSELISYGIKKFFNVIQDFLPFFLKFKGRMILALFALIGAKATLVSVL